MGGWFHEPQQSHALKQDRGLVRGPRCLCSWQGPEPWPRALGRGCCSEGPGSGHLRVGASWREGRPEGKRGLRPGLVEGEACVAQKTGPGAPISWKGPEGPWWVAGRQGPGVQHPALPQASWLRGVASAPAIPSSSSEPTEGPLFRLPAVPAGRLGTGPTALTLSPASSRRAVPFEVGQEAPGTRSGHRKRSPSVHFREGTVQAPPRGPGGQGLSTLAPLGSDLGRRLTLTSQMGKLRP